MPIQYNMCTAIRQGHEVEEEEVTVAVEAQEGNKDIIQNKALCETSCRTVRLGCLPASGALCTVSS